MFWISHTRHCCFYYCYAFAAPIVLLGLATAAHAYSAHADARLLLDELRALTTLTQLSISTLSRHVDDILTHACAESASSSSSSSSRSSSKSEDDDEDAQII